MEVVEVVEVVSKVLLKFRRAVVSDRPPCDDPWSLVQKAAVSVCESVLVIYVHVVKNK